MLEQQANLGESAVHHHLAASSHALNGFLAFHRCSSYDDRVVSIASKTRQGIFRELEGYLLPRIVYHFENLMEDLTPGDAAEIITWIYNFLEAMEDNFPDVKVSSTWATDMERLLEHYIEQGVRRNLRELIQRSLALQSITDVRRNREGHIVTDHPEDVIVMLDSQLEVARQCLPAKYTQLVFAERVKELSGMVSDLMLQIETTWKSIGSSRYCAFINDAIRLADLVDKRIEANISDAIYREKRDTLARDLTQLSALATKYLCHGIFLAPKNLERILTSVGEAEWELDETGHVIGTTIATLKEYFADLETWLASDFYFPKILQICFDLTLQTYVESFFSNTSTHGVHNPRLVAVTLSDDYSRFVAFFNGDTFEEYSGRGGFYTLQELNSKLHLLKNISNIIHPSNEPEDLLQDIKAISRELLNNQNDAPAILHLAGLRKKRNSTKASAGWLRAIAHANEALVRDLEATSFNNNTSYFRLPDLRNSKYIRNIRVDKASIEKEISARSPSTVQATCKLLQTRRRNKYMHAVTKPLRRTKVFTWKTS